MELAERVSHDPLNPEPLREYIAASPENRKVLDYEWNLGGISSRINNKKLWRVLSSPTSPGFTRLSTTVHCGPTDRIEWCVYPTASVKHFRTLGVILRDPVGFRVCRSSASSIAPDIARNIKTAYRNAIILRDGLYTSEPDWDYTLSTGHDPWASKVKKSFSQKDFIKYMNGNKATKAEFITLLKLME